MLGAPDSDVGAFHVCLRSIPDGLNVTFLEEFDGAASFERPIARTKPLAYSLLGQRNGLHSENHGLGNRKDLRSEAKVG